MAGGFLFNAKCIMQNYKLKVESVGRGLAPAVKKGNGLPRLLRRLAMTDQCHSERSEESVSPNKEPVGQAPLCKGSWILPKAKDERV